MAFSGHCDTLLRFIDSSTEASSLTKLTLHVSAAGVRVQAGGLQHPLLAVPQAPAHDYLKVLYSELLSVYHC